MEQFQKAGKIGSGMVVAVTDGKRPVSVLHMTYVQKALIGSSDYFPENVATVMQIVSGGTHHRSISPADSKQKKHFSMPESRQLCPVFAVAYHKGGGE